MKPDILTLNQTSFSEAVIFLCKHDLDLARVVEKYGQPPMWNRPPGFATLVHIILEQQVSLASARAAFEKLSVFLGNITPENFLELSDLKLKEIGFSRQKTLYTRNLANAIVNGNLNLKELEDLPDELVKAELTKLKGIGNWTADIYLLMCLNRADAFPSGDLALIVSAQTVKKLLERPSSAKLEVIGELWRPFRAVAARILWHFYLSEIRPYKNY